MRKILKFFSSYYRKYRKETFLTFIMQALQKLSVLIIPILTKKIMDIAAVGENVEELNFYGFLFLGVTILFIIFLSLRYYYQSNLEIKVLNDLKFEISEKVLKIPYPVFLKKDPGYFIQRINRDIEKIRDLVISDGSMFIINIVYMISIIVLMFRINILISLILLMMFPVFYFLSKKFIPKIKKVNEELMKSEEKFNSHMNESINSNYFIRVSNYSGVFGKNAELKLKDIYKKVLEKIKYEIAYDFFLVTGIMNISSVLIYWLGSYLVFENAITFGSLTAISLYFSRLWSPVEFFMDFPKKIKEEEISLNRIEELLGEKEELAGENLVRIPEKFEKVEIKNLSFHYGEKTIFHDMSLKINPGDRIGIIGENGTGKTTLANILIKIFTDYDGTINYSGTDYKNINPVELRNKIILIPQELCVFEDFEKSERNEKTKNKSKSGGEKKAIQIKEGLKRRGEMYIFDEPLAYVDEQRKREFISFIEKEFENKTFIMISHDADIFSCCNKMYRIENRKINKV